jgi:flagellar protein FliS
MNLPAQSVLSRYGAVKVTTANPGQLLIMLYDGLFRFLREAQSAMAANDRARAGERIGRAIAIVNHLLGTLDDRHAPTLCDKLQGLYRFCLSHLLKANIEQSSIKIDEVLRMLAPLREAWVTAVATLASKPAAT